MSAEVERSRGKCPLTPQEVGLMLRALGFVNNTYLYVASGEIYGGEATLQPLKDLFPNFYTKEMLSGNDLKPFLPFSSRLAAIDYIVCNESDVFATNNNGNMAKILAGHRRYMGHKRTIRPNAKKLSSLFKAWKQMEWEMFSRKVKLVQRRFMGEPDEMRPGRGDFHEFPSSCICQNPDHLVVGWISMKPGVGGNETFIFKDIVKSCIIRFTISYRTGVSSSAGDVSSPRARRRNLSTKPRREARVGIRNVIFFSPRSAKKPAGEDQESSVGFLGSPFSSPLLLFPSTDTARNRLATVKIDCYRPIAADDGRNRVLPVDFGW
ncbi:hypothetical protein BHE74_00018035 [Ensete ventricosum]|nr:hypothetical protein BHE74_00018035 [Ensete ventricosum]